jgi:hypothetical protein
LVGVGASLVESSVDTGVPDAPPPAVEPPLLDANESLLS